MPTSTLTSKGQTTIPKAIRDALGLRPGDRLDFTIEEDGRLVVRPATLDVRDLEGILRRPEAEPVSVDEMERAVRERAVADDRS